MITLLSDHYVAQPVTVNDLQIACLALGFTVGFGFLTTWTAMRQTADIHRRYGYSKLNSPYIWMIWLEILVCLIFSVICWLHLNHIIPPRYLIVSPSIIFSGGAELTLGSFAFYFVIRRSKEPRITGTLLIRCSYNLGSSSPIPSSDHYQQSFVTPH